MDISVTRVSTVLLASPFGDERAAYAAALRERGYELREVADAAALLAAAEEEPPNLIICEIMLPDEDALTVSRKLRGMPLTSDVPFMVLSGAVGKVQSDGVAGSDRKPCPVHLVVQQADTLIAFARSLGERAGPTRADSNRLATETRRRDDGNETRSRRHV